MVPIDDNILIHLHLRTTYSVCYIFTPRQQCQAVSGTPVQLSAVVETEIGRRMDEEEVALIIVSSLVADFLPCESAVSHSLGIKSLVTE